MIPHAHSQVVAFLANGVSASLPVDIQDNRFFFKAYAYAMIQTLEASTGPAGTLALPVAQWGPLGPAGHPDTNSAIPVQVQDLFFDSNGDGQFETFEYVDRRFVCPDGAQDCVPLGNTVGSFTCPTGMCDAAAGACPAGAPFCNSGEIAQPPLDISFVADVKDGIMNNYDINRHSYRGETALYHATVNPGYAPAKQSNTLLSNIFGSPLLSNVNNINPVLYIYQGGAVDLTGEPININDYQNAAAAVLGTEPSPLALSFNQSPNSPFKILQTFDGPQEALISYPDPTSATGTSKTLIPWVRNQPGNGFLEAQVNNSELDYFVQTSSIDFTGISTNANFDYTLVPLPLPDGGAAPSATVCQGVETNNPQCGVEAMGVESTDFLGDVFMCYEAAANPPLLAVRMYTPTLAVLNWLNSVPQSYADCGIIVRWSPFDNYPTLIESTTNGVRLDVTQGGGLGRVVGANLYVPGLPFEE